MYLLLLLPCTWTDSYRTVIGNGISGAAVVGIGGTIAGVSRFKLKEQEFEEQLCRDKAK